MQGNPIIYSDPMGDTVRLYKGSGHRSINNPSPSEIQNQLAEGLNVSPEENPFSFGDKRGTDLEYNQQKYDNLY
jgi:hypothetical protein